MLIMPKKEVKKFNPAKIKIIILALIIAIVLCAFVIYLIQAIHPSPKWEDYCGRIKEPMLSQNQEMTKELCEANKGTWTSQEIQCAKAPCPQGYCDFYTECNKEFQGVQDSYNLIVFIVAVIVGLIAVATGIILQLTSVSSGLMLGGAFLIFYGTMTYWYKLTNWIRVILLGIALAILIWLGYKKLKN